ncbi:MAG TPA: biotin transporter BioY [Candidatus Polarisedimenticolia bacterium]|nr:biotin transporter BioY [Candidatus Polarisedimenticolia bacterium]
MSPVPRRAEIVLPARSRAAAFVLQGVPIVGFAFLTWAGAKISLPLPFTPVPGTLQTLAVLLAGAFLGARGGAASQAFYLGLGIAGLPVFALPGGGPGYFLGPTGGYLLGFVAAAGVTGAVLSRTGRMGVVGAFLAFLSGSAALYVCGLFWLTIYMGGDLGAAVRGGLLPFVLFDLAKVVIATGLQAGRSRLSPRS